jgi:ubiquinone biosynthesis protein
MLRHLKNSLRLFRIAWVLARYDALFPLEQAGFSPVMTFCVRLLARRRNRKERRGVRLSRALQALGPTFIKLGQTLSTRADLIGDDIADDLANLRDNLPPFPVEDVHRIIEEDLEKPTSALFDNFEEIPVAAASIAQVHFATLKDGRDAAVKVLRPGVDRAFRRDIELFYWLAELVEQNVPSAERLKPKEVVRTLGDSIKMELDLRYEAAASAELRQNLQDDPGIYIPEIYWAHTGPRVIVMERIRGVPISDVETLKAQGHNMQDLVKTAAEVCFNMVYRDGYFHADMHPGNLFVLPDGRIAAVDFGIMGRVSPQERQYLVEILRGFLTKDYRRVAEIHFAAGYVPAHQSVDHFTLACAAIGRPILDKPLHEISLAKLLAQLFEVAEQFEMETQPQLLLLQKTMMVAEGVGRMLDPKVNMWQLAEPLVAEWITKNLNPVARIRTGFEQLQQNFHKIQPTIAKVEALIKRIDADGFTLHPDTVENMARQRRQHHQEWMLLAVGSVAILTLAILLG